MIDFFYFDRLTSGAPSQKIVLSIATFGRTWKLDADSEIAGVPPIHTDGPGEAGKYSLVIFHVAFIFEMSMDPGDNLTPQGQLPWMNWCKKKRIEDLVSVYL